MHEQGLLLGRTVRQPRGPVTPARNQIRERRQLPRSGPTQPVAPSFAARLSQRSCIAAGSLNLPPSADDHAGKKLSNVYSANLLMLPSHGSTLQAAYRAWWACLVG